MSSIVRKRNKESLLRELNLNDEEANVKQKFMD